MKLKHVLKFSQFDFTRFVKISIALISLCNFGIWVLIPLINRLRYFNCFDSSDGIFQLSWAISSSAILTAGLFLSGIPSHGIKFQG